MFRILLIFLLFPFCFNAQSYPSAPVNYVTDEAQALRDDEETSLNAILKAFEDSTSIQLFVYTASSLNNAVMADLCQEIFRTWKIGNKQTNNGILIGIFVDDHKFRIHTGYGMEGVLPDLLTKRIQDENMRPYFKQEDYYGGIYAGVNKLIYYSKNEYVPVDDAIFGFNKGFVFVYIIQVILFFVQCIILFGSFRGTTSSKWNMFILGLIALAIPCAGLVGLIMLIIGSYNEGRTRSKGSTYRSETEPFFSVSWGSNDSSSDSGSSFDGGSGGDSGGGGSDSSW